LDIDESLSPDVLGEVTDMPFMSNSFDLVVCFQVLEHIPFNDFDRALSEIARVTKRKAIISLPYAYHEILSFSLNSKKRNLFNFRFILPRFYKKRKFNGQHYWEIGERGYSEDRIECALKKHFFIRKQFRPHENTYHTFFVLEKNDI
jgi:ubiquinone/menaquinone biosynthesis C-methylase UbiE